MKGIDWQATPKRSQYHIYLEYISCEYKKRNAYDKKFNKFSSEWKPEQVYLKFKNRDDDYEYFIYLCKVRPYDDIWNYFKGEQVGQNERFESNLGLFN